jgi:serine/threonine-protein kinase
MPDQVSPEFLALQQAVVGRYSLERELGRGGMGIVFLARDVALDRLVAIKLLPPALAAKPGLRERFLREAQTAAKLSQPNIVPIHAVETSAELVWFVMAFVDGETLGERLRARGALTPHETARMLQEVAWALGYAHGRGVVHRDVKPDNIMIERGSGRALVMDFGIAARTEDALGHEILGTAQYISPEQANGDPVDGRADLYSLGVVAFLALTGRLPFNEVDPTALLAMHITRPAPPVASVAPGIPRKLAQAVDRCLAKKPDERFPDGEALAESVSKAIEPKRELPVAVRTWLARGQERLGYLIWYGMAGPSVGMITFGVMNGILGVSGVLSLMSAITVYTVTPFAVHGGYRLWRLRRLLGEGYSIEDARAGVREFAERRREELTYEFGANPPLWSKVSRILMLTSGVVAIGTFAGFVSDWLVSSNAVGLTMLVSSASWVGNAALQTLRPGRRITRDWGAELQLKFWNSRMVKWFEKLARFGLKRKTVAAELTYRPTEMAIGIAADALFDSLPKDQRKELRELPPLIDRLQLDAARMRKVVDDLNDALAGIGEQSAASQSSALRGDAGASLVSVRDKLQRDLTVRRDEAAARLGAAVAALENIRLNLLRLRAGTGTVAELTADLGAARDAQREIERAAEAREEVEALLRGARSVTGQLSPVSPHG